MEIKMNKEEFVELSDGLEEVVSLAKKMLLNNLTFNQNLADFAGQSSAKLTMHAQRSEKDALELAYRLEKLAELFEKLAA
ncbi:MAG: hypothetical protein ACI33M_07545 [Lysinibacillus sp.]